VPYSSGALGEQAQACPATLALAADKRDVADSCLREADFLTVKLPRVDREIARYAQDLLGIGC
jgi:hypothetical protein